MHVRVAAAERRVRPANPRELGDVREGVAGRVEVRGPEDLAVRGVVAAVEVLLGAVIEVRDAFLGIEERERVLQRGSVARRVEEEAVDVVVVDEVHEQLRRRHPDDLPLRVQPDDAPLLRHRPVVRRLRVPERLDLARSPPAASARGARSRRRSRTRCSAARSRRRCRAFPAACSCRGATSSPSNASPNRRKLLFPSAARRVRDGGGERLPEAVLDVLDRVDPEAVEVDRLDPLRVRIDERRAHLRDLGREVLQPAGEVAEDAPGLAVVEVRGCGRSRGTRRPCRGCPARAARG